MTKRTILKATLLALASSTAAGACPWASSAYTASVPPDITLDFRFNGDCTVVEIIDSGGTPQSLSTTASRKGWTVKYDGTTLVFDPK